MNIIDLIFQAALVILSIAFYITFGIYIGLKYKSFDNFMNDVVGKRFQEWADKLNAKKP